MFLGLVGTGWCGAGVGFGVVVGWMQLWCSIF